MAPRIDAWWVSRYGMPALTIPLKEAGPWVARLGRAMPEAAHRGLVAAAFRLAGHLKTLRLPLDRGTYRAGWNAEKTDDGAAVFNKTIQAVLVEGGVRPENVRIGRKMIDALAEWAGRKGLGSTGSSKIAWRRRRAAPDVLRGIAWGVARNIKKRGLFEAQNGGMRPLEKATKTVGVEFVRQEVLRAIKREFGA